MYRPLPDYYDHEYAHQEMLQHDVPFFLDHLPPRRRVLELAAGTGRAAIPIALAGHRVLAIDHDPAMLRLAEADLLTLDLAETFDWIALLFNTFLIFTTLEEQDRLLQNVRNHLKPRGHFWLDIFQPNLQLLAQDVSKNLEPMTFYVPHLDRTVFKTTDVRRDPARQVQRITYHYTWFDPAGRPRRQKSQFDLTFLFPRELRLLLERNGLTLARLYGNYDGSPLTADSPRMIAMCGKR